MMQKISWVHAAVLVFFAWQFYELNESVKRLQMTVNSVQRPSQAPDVVNALNPPLVQIQKNQTSIVAGLSYIEIMLEGVVRKQGLPLQGARDLFNKIPGNPPAGWRWQTPWEDVPAPVPAPASNAEKPTSR
jgi:hypothetical protein